MYPMVSVLESGGYGKEFLLDQAVPIKEGF